MNELQWGGHRLPKAVMQHLRVGVPVRPAQYVWDGENFYSDQLQYIDRTTVSEAVDVVVVDNFVGVVAANLAQAQTAAQELHIEWEKPAATPSLKGNEPSQICATSGAGSQVVEPCESGSSHNQVYGWPSRMRWGDTPGWVLAEYSPKRLRVWGATVTPESLVRELTVVTGLEASQIELYGAQPDIVSGLGRHCGDDAVVDAALMSQSLGCPVAVWLDAAYNRDRNALGQAQRMSLEATLDETGRITNYRSLQASPSQEVPAVGLWLSGKLASQVDKTIRERGASGSPYELGDEQHVVRQAGSVPDPDNTALEEAQQTFARESFLDEVAHANGQDPVALRLKHLDDQRSCQLITAVSRRARWNEPKSESTAAVDQLVGRGFAYAQWPDRHQRNADGTRSAWIADVTVNRITGEVQLSRLVVGQDSGSEVDTERLQETLQARVLEQASRPLLGRETSFDEWGDDVTSSEIESKTPGHLIRQQALPTASNASSKTMTAWPTDIDFSPGVAVIANALFDATGIRFRQPPFTASRLRNAIAEQESAPQKNAGKGRRSAGRRWLAATAIAAVTSAVAVAWPWKGVIAPIKPPTANLYSAATIERGRLVAAAGNCVGCHTAEGGKENAGGHAFKTPFGKIYSTNLTPDEETGIGSWSYAAFERSMRQGISRDGRHLYPAFPYTAFAKISDTDMQALYAYLMSRPATSAEAPKNALTFPFNLRQGLAGWNALYHDPAPFTPDPSQSELYNRGAYLAEGLGHCSACHSPRNALGAERQGDDYLAGAMIDGWEAPPLNTLSRSPIAWSEASLYEYLRKGKARLHGVASGSMASVVASMKELPKYDVRAIAHYVAVQMDAPKEDSEGTQAEAQQRIAQAKISPAGNEAGERLFEGACAACHEESSLPSIFRADTSLALNTNLHSEYPDNVIQSILSGVHDEYVPGSGSMPGFAESFSNSQVTTLVTYLRARFAPNKPSWTNVESRVDELREDL